MAQRKKRRSPRRPRKIGRTTTSTTPEQADLNAAARYACLTADTTIKNSHIAEIVSMEPDPEPEPDPDPKMTLEIDTNHVPSKIVSGKALGRFKGAIVAACNEIGLVGKWSILELRHEGGSRKQQRDKLGTRKFHAQQVVDIKGRDSSGIKFIVEAYKDQKGVFCGILAPSADTKAGYESYCDIRDILYRFQSKTKLDFKPIDPATSKPKIGDQYLARIVKFCSTPGSEGVFVCLRPDDKSEQPNAICRALELRRSFTSADEIQKIFKLNQLILVQVIELDDEVDGFPVAVVSRKVLLPDRDLFNLKYENNKWTMANFTDSRERMMIFLDMVRNAIERYATNEHWKKACAKELYGEVFLEDPSLRSAPAYLVKSLVSRGIIKKWAPTARKEHLTRLLDDSQIRTSHLFKKLADDAYIICTKATINSQPNRDLAYCMWEEGYNVLCRKNPFLGDGLPEAVDQTSTPVVEEKPKAVKPKPKPKPKPRTPILTRKAAGALLPSTPPNLPEQRTLFGQELPEPQTEATPDPNGKEVKKFKSIEEQEEKLFKDPTMASEDTGKDDTTSEDDTVAKICEQVKEYAAKTAQKKKVDELVNEAQQTLNSHKKEQAELDAWLEKRKWLSEGWRQFNN